MKFATAASKAPSSDRNRFNGADPRVDATCACEVDHLLGLVEGDHLHSGCLYSRCEVAGAAAKLDHALRLELEQGVERDVIRRRPGATRPERPAGGEA